MGFYQIWINIKKGVLALLVISDYLWSVTNGLVKDYGFSLLDTYDSNNINENSVLNLIKESKGQFLYIRLIPSNYVWPNHLQNDINETGNIAYQMQRKLHGKRLKVLSLYVFQSSPSEALQETFIENSRISDGKKVEYFTGFIDLEKKRLGVPGDTFSNFTISKEAFVYYFDDQISVDPKEILGEIRSLEEDRVKDIREVFNYGKPIFTYIFIAINAIIFLLMTFMGGSTNSKVLLDFGALEPFLITNGEYWRFITPIFLHIGFMHFAFNNLALYYLGKLTERIFGSTRFIIIYLLAGLIGNIVSFLLVTTTISAGASGAIYGLFGALLYFGYVYPNLFFRTMGKDILTIIGINIIFSLSVPNINFYAHIGGLVGGFLVSAIIYLPKQKTSKMFVRIISIFLILALLVGVWWGINKREVKGSPSIYFIGEEALQNEDIHKAYLIFHHLVTTYPEVSDFQYQYANVVFQQGNPKLAEVHYKKFLELDSNLSLKANAHYQLALIYYFDNDLDKAEIEANEVLKIIPDSKEAKQLLDEINKAKVNNNINLK